MDHNLPSLQASQQLPNDASVQGSVFPSANPPSVKKTLALNRTLVLEDELLSSCLQEMKCPKEDISNTKTVFIPDPFIID